MLQAIHLIYFFTAGEDEVKCWQIPRGTKAPQAAGCIHTDFERGFICAETMTYADLKELGSEMAVRAAGKYRQQGKEYVVQVRSRDEGLGCLWWASEHGLWDKGWHAKGAECQPHVSALGSWPGT